MAIQGHLFQMEPIPKRLPRLGNRICCICRILRLRVPLPQRRTPRRGTWRGAPLERFFLRARAVRRCERGVFCERGQSGGVRRRFREEQLVCERARERKCIYISRKRRKLWPGLLSGKNESNTNQYKLYLEHGVAKETMLKKQHNVRYMSSCTR